MPFKAILIAATVVWTTTPLDLAWAKLAHDAATGDQATFVADRDRVVTLIEKRLVVWQVRPRETYSDGGLTVTTYDGPAAVRSERSRSPFFAVVKSAAGFAPPMFWELTPGFSPPGKRYWFLTANSCDLKTGNGIAGHPFHWTKGDTEAAPSYAEFKAELMQLAGTARAFPTDTAISRAVGVACFDVGNLSSLPSLRRR